jgi:amino acid transporter
MMAAIIPDPKQVLVNHSYDSYGTTEPLLANETDDEPRESGGDPYDLDESDFVTVREDQDLRRGLHQRHIGLIAIAGAIVSSCRLVSCFP